MTSQIRKRKSAIKETLPEIPKKLYFSIGEVSRLCGLRQHVLRYWETRFSQQLKLKKRSGRRYYEKEHILLIRHLKTLLYVQGYTIEGAKQYLTQYSRQQPVEDGATPESSENMTCELDVKEKKEQVSSNSLPAEVIITLESFIKELESLVTTA
jgi:DNA-binding transcriptional MerR regulator